MDMFLRQIVDEHYAVPMWPMGCVEMGSEHGNGYRRVRFKGRRYYAHRLTFELYHGHPPENEIDHLCRNPACCNPLHLEGVTHAENCARAITRNSKKTHCPQGHEYDLRYRNGTYMARRCSVCLNRQRSEYLERRGA